MFHAACSYKLETEQALCVPCLEPPDISIQTPAIIPHCLKAQHVAVVLDKSSPLAVVHCIAQERFCESFHIVLVSSSSRQTRSGLVIVKVGISIGRVTVSDGSNIMNREACSRMRDNRLRIPNPRSNPFDDRTEEHSFWPTKRAFVWFQEIVLGSEGGPRRRVCTRGASEG